jgi:predicted acyl esterase
MTFDKDVLIPMRDGAALRGNLFRPRAQGQFPVIMTFGPYGKDIHLKDFRLLLWEAIEKRFPQILKASSCKHLVFETPDPEVWVPHGYAVLKVDSRGAGKSPGKLDVNSPAEFRDFYDVIEWAGTQPWSNGKIGLLGISYYAAGQWAVAAMRPPHLAALLPWMGCYDFFRDRTRQDGIFGSGFVKRWWANSVLHNQYGNPGCTKKDMYTGERNTGPASLTPDELKANRGDYVADILAHPTLDDWYRERIPDLSTIELPTLVVANWDGLGLHLRGTIAGYMDIASREKWLKINFGPAYFLTFLTPESVAMQRKFFDRYLKGVDNGWETEPRVTVAIRSPANDVKRVIAAAEWPLPGTQWTRLYLDAVNKGLSPDTPTMAASATYLALSEGFTFMSAPMDREIEMAGPVKAKLWVSSSTEDMDIFATLRAFDPQGNEVTFNTAAEPKCPVSQGWLRVSQRKLDLARTTEYRPWHSHDESQKLEAGEIYEVDVEIWATSLALPTGYRLALTLQGKDFERPDAQGPLKGSGHYTHTDPVDRPPESFAGANTIHTGTERNSYLLLPVLTAA